MKKWISAVLFVFIVALIAPVSMVQAELKKVPLVYSDHIPPMAGGNIFLKKVYFPKLQEQLAAVGYTLDITFYHAGSLYQSTQQIQACEQGLIDMTVAVLPYELARFPLHEVLDMGYMGWDAQGMLKVWNDLSKEVPEFDKELSKNFVEFIRFVPTKKYIHTNLGANIRTVQDFKGKKIHSAGMNAEYLKKIGAIPIQQNPGDWYTSLDRGLFNGIIVAFDMVGIFKLFEVLDTHVLPYHDSLGHTAVTHVFSKKKFFKMPKEVQKVFLDNMEWAGEAITAFEANNVPFYHKGATEKGNSFIELTEAETAEWKAAANEVHMEWIKEKEKKGLPAQKVYDATKRLAEKHNKQ